MHATQTTTTTAQSIAPASSRAKAQLASADVTPVQAAIQAVERHGRDVMDPAYRAYSKAEEERWAAEKALKAVSFPSELMVVPKMTDEPLTWVTALVHRHSDGRETRVEIERDNSLRLETRDAVIEYFGDGYAELDLRLAALQAWETETAALRTALERAEAKAERLDRAWQRSYDMNDRLCRAILRAPAETNEAATQVEAYARLLASAERTKRKPADIAHIEDAQPMVAFMHRALKSLGGNHPCDPGDHQRAGGEAEGAIFGREAITAAWDASGVRAKWDAAVATVDAARAGYMEARQAQYDFEDAYPDVPASDPAYAALEDAHDAADTAHFAALRALLGTPAPDAAALARQIQVYAWLNNVTSYKIDGLTGWALDPTNRRVTDAIDADPDADNDDRGILALYRSALALAGGNAPPPVAPEIEECTRALLAAE
jgi:hypothetical protein